MTRRDLFRLAGVGVASSLAGCGGVFSDGTSDTPPTTPSTESPQASSPLPLSDYETVVDVVEAGADPTGEEPIESHIQDAIEDDTLLYFPEGDYRISETLRFKGADNVGFVGDSATWIPTDGLKYWTIGIDVANVRFEGLTLDHTAEGSGPQVQLHFTGGTSVIRDVTVRGFHDSRHIAFVPYVESPEASLLIERLNLPDGSSDVPAVFMGKPSVGSVTFRDCYIEHWSQGIYASPHTGPILVEGGEYANNNRAGIRVGGGTHGAVIRNVHVRIDDPIPDRWVDRQDIRGIWLRKGDGSLIENCTIEMLDLQGVGSSAAVMLGKLMGRLTVRNTVVRMEDGYHGIRTQPPAADESELEEMDELPDEWWLRCENVHVTGTVEKDGNAIRVLQRDQSVFRNVTIDQQAKRRVGIFLSPKTRRCRLEGESVIASGFPMVVKRARVEPPEECSIDIAAETTFQSTRRDGRTRSLYAKTNGGYCVAGTLLSATGAPSTSLSPRNAIILSAIKDQTLVGRLVPFAEYQGFFD